MTHTTETTPNAEKIAAGLTELAERVEAATGPDRELDREIELAVFPSRVSPEPTVPLLAYTASIDAALTLVPKGWEGEITLHGHVELTFDRMRGPQVEGNAATPALALCAAALRASEILRREA